jgi:hypothetical protein
MALVKRIAIALVLSALPFAGTFLYCWIWREYYFPDRYEDTFMPYGIAALASVVVFPSVVAYSLASWRRPNR